MKQKHLFALFPIVFAAIFFNCADNGIDTIVLQGKDRGSAMGDVPLSIIPNSIRTLIESTTPIYKGTTPPSIIGMYRINNIILSGDGGGSGIGNITNLYFDFSNWNNGTGTISYRETRNGIQYSYYDVEARIVGDGNNFSIYFTGSDGLSYVISGTLTGNGGISNFYYIVINPNDASCGCSSFRTFKDDDGYIWNIYVPPGEIPIPPEIKDKFEEVMPIYIGTDPPDISGQYIANNFIMIGSSISGDRLDNLADLYLAFVKGSDGTLSYREKQGTSQAGSDNVIVDVVGNGNDFTAYFEAVGESNGIMTRMSTVISGTWTSTGINNFNYAFIMVEKGPDPDNKLVAVNTYRIFKDGDGFAEKYNWLALSSSSSIPRSSSSSAGGYSSSSMLGSSSSSIYVVSSSSVVQSSSSEVVYSSSFAQSSSSIIIIRSTFTDDRDGREYKAVQIGDQIWMAENLNYGNATCYAQGVSDVSADSVAKNCELYGRLYSWSESAIRTLCPSGWRFPSDSDWGKLKSYVGGLKAGMHLKAMSGWDNCGPDDSYLYRCEDTYGFAALPGGLRNSNGVFSAGNKYGRWWSSSYSSSPFMWYLDYNDDSFSNGNGNSSSTLISVRCVKD